MTVAILTNSLVLVLAISSTLIRKACACSSLVDLTATSVLQTFTSPGYPKAYTNNLDICYLIAADVTGSRVKLTVYDVNTEQRNDYLKIYAGQTNSSFLYRSYSGNNGVVNDEYQSSSAYMLVYFHSDGSSTNIGFRAAYEKIANTSVPGAADGCSAPTYQYTADTSTKRIILSNYVNNMDIYYLIVKPDTVSNLMINIVSAWIEQSSGCVFDSLKIYNGPCTTFPEVTSICGVVSDSIYHISGNRYTLLHFHSDHSATQDGFNVEYSLSTVFTTESEEESTFDPKWVSVIFVGCLAFGGILTTIICCCNKQPSTKNKVHSSSTAPKPKPRTTPKPKPQLTRRQTETNLISSISRTPLSPPTSTKIPPRLPPLPSRLPPLPSDLHSLPSGQTPLPAYRNPSPTRRSPSPSRRKPSPPPYIPYSPSSSNRAVPSAPPLELISGILPEPGPSIQVHYPPPVHMDPAYPPSLAPPGVPADALGPFVAVPLDMLRHLEPPPSYTPYDTNPSTKHLQ